MRDLSCRVVPVRDGEAALDQAINDVPALIITEVALPGVCGIETVAASALRLSAVKSPSLSSPDGSWPDSMVWPSEPGPTPSS